MKNNNVKTQDVGQTLVDPTEKLRKESAVRSAERSKSNNAIPKISTVMSKSISEKSDWESKTDGTKPGKSRNFPGTDVPHHEHAKNTGEDIPEPTAFESGINHDPRERSSGRKLRKAK